jgi:hypothetical protein
MSKRPVGNSRKFDKRGNSTDRKNRKIWMLSTPQFGGDGTKVACVHCSALVDYDGVQADRIKPGGTYARTNVQPSCATCNNARSDNAEWVYAG